MKMSMYEAEVRKFLDLSTAHMTETDSKILEMQPKSMTVISYEEGFFVYTGPRDCAGDTNEFIEDMEGNALSDAFQKVMLYARDLDCAYVCFDRDAGQHPDFEVFDW